MSIACKVRPIGREALLPDGYRRCEYLESTGTQWIDTGVKLSNESEVRCVYETDFAYPADYMSLFGVDGKFYCFVSYPQNITQHVSVYVGNYVPRCYWLRQYGICTLVLNGEFASYNGNIQTFAGVSNFETLESGALFKSTGKALYIGKIYAFSISRNNQLQLNFIPCLDDKGKPCMFDTVSRTPYYNKGTGDFLYKLKTPLIRKLPRGYQSLECLESTGTQWIDTGIKLSNDSDFKITCEFFSESEPDGNSHYAFGIGSNSIACYPLLPARYLPHFYLNGTYITFGDPAQRCVVEYTNNYVILNGIKQIFSNAGEAVTASESIAVFACRLGLFPLIGSFYSFGLSRNGVLQLDLIPCLDDKGNPCMWDYVTRRTFYNQDTTDQFIAGMTWEQVRKLQLPTTGGQLTLSLPYEASLDGIAQTALEQARANGWELTLQYDEAEIPEGYTRVDYLENPSSAYLNLPYQASSETCVECEFLHNGSNAWTSLFGTTPHPRYAVYFTPRIIQWHYSDDGEGQEGAGHGKGKQIVSGGAISFGVRYLLKKDKEKNYIDGVLVAQNDIVTIPWRNTKNPFLVFKGENNTYSCPARLYWFNISENGELKYCLIPTLDQTGTPCMYDLVSHQSFYNKGTGSQFTAGMTLEQVRDLSLPAGGGQLTLALPYEASLDGLAQDALEQARENGWVLALQYDEAVVPAGYSKVDFLESTGTQYIDTGLKLSNESEVRCEFMLSSVSVNGKLFGADNNGLTPMFRLYAPLSQNIYFYSGSTESTKWIASWSDAKKEMYSLVANTRQAVLNDRTSTNKFEEVSWETDYSAAVFGCHVMETYWQPHPGARIYSFNISRNNSLQLAYIPCLDLDGVPCMYDLVSQQAFRNSGTGQFVVGMTMKQALSIANLPAPITSNILTISLPKEASLVLYNQEVEAALNTAAEKGWYITVQYRDEFEDEAILNKYAECTTIAEVEAVNPDFANDLTSDAEWIYPLPKLQDISDSGNTNPRWPAGVKVWRADLPSLTSAGSMFKYNNSLIEFYGDLPAVIGNGYEQAFESNVFRKFVGSLRSLINGNQFFWYCRNMEEFVSSLSALSTGQYMFVDAKLNKESALCVVNTIPAYTSGSHPLTLGIHIDHKYDPELNLALKKADINYEPTVELTEEVTTGKGWTVDVQWNGTPTSTTGTFDRGTIIYAKVGEIEHPDGTIEQFLDWGQHVTDWEARGYEQFRSLNSAYEYFGLKHETNE